MFEFFFCIFLLCIFNIQLSVELVSRFRTGALRMSYWLDDFPIDRTDALGMGDWLNQFPGLGLVLCK